MRVRNILILPAVFLFLIISSVKAGLDDGLVWQEASEAIVDMYMTIYDPVVMKWSKPQLLTADDLMEYGMAPGFDTSGDLIVAYDKSHTVYETRTLEVGEDEFEVEAPVPDQVDLYVLRHRISGDLSVISEDITITPPNPVAGDLTVICANVENPGDILVFDLDVAFWDGDPEYDGSPFV